MYIAEYGTTEAWSTGMSQWTATEPEFSTGQFLTTPMTTTAAETTETKDTWYPGKVADGFINFLKWFGIALGALAGLSILGSIIGYIYEVYDSKKRINPQSNLDFIEVEENTTPRNSQTSSDKPPLYDDLSVDITLPTYDDCNNTPF